MPTLDFKEIPRANEASGAQDTFEFLARDFFKMLGFEVESGPDRGQDDGRDLLVIEQREGVLGTSRQRWMVSCKHKAHSGQAVNAGDEEDLSDRVQSHNAQGFIGFYSAIISAPLSRKLQGLKSKFETKTFDLEDIETVLLSSRAGRDIAKRYFPRSYGDWELYNQEPANFLSEYHPLNCVVCGKDLLAVDNRSSYGGIVVWVRKYEPEELVRRYVDFYWVCKGQCDMNMSDRYAGNYQTSWEDITDILIPTNYIKWHIGIMNAIYEGRSEYSCESFERVKDFTIQIAQLVVRNQTEDQTNRLIALAELAELPPGI